MAAIKWDWRSFLTKALLAIFAFWQIVPWKAKMPSDQLDSCWAVGLHMKFSNGFDYGNSAFTFGPWGFIFSGYTPGTYLMVIGCWLLIAWAIVLGVREIAKRFERGSWYSIVWMFALIAVVGCTGRLWLGNDADPYPPDIKLFALITILAACKLYPSDGDKSERVVALGILTLAISLASLVKFSSFMLAAAVIAIISLSDIRRRRVPWIAMGFVPCTLAFWLMAGQRLSSIPSFVKYSMQVASGYTEAMSIWTDGEMTKLLMFWMCGGLVIALTFWSPRAVFLERAGVRVLDEEAEEPSPPPSPGIPREGVMRALAVAAIIFLAYKSGFVRCDGLHEPAAVITLLAIAMIFYAANQPRQMPGIVSKLWITALFGIIGLTVFSIAGDLPKKSDVSADKKITLPSDYQDRLKYIRRQYPLPEIRGTVDVYPWGESILLAHDLRYDPRPVPQSYAAFSPSLLEMNAAHLRGREAPGTILFAVLVLGGAYPPQQDATSWPEIFTRYDIADASGEYLFMHQSTQPRKYSINPIGSQTGEFGHEIQVPSMDQGPVWMTLDIHPTRAKALFDLLYKPPVVSIEVTDVTEHKDRFRMIPSIARAGWLISPGIANTHGFAALASSDWKQLLKDREIKSFKVFQEPEGSSAYQSTFSVSFSRLDFPHADVSGVRGFEPGKWSMSEIEKLH